MLKRYPKDWKAVKPKIVRALGLMAGRGVAVRFRPAIDLYNIVDKSQ
jgi:hypothetical protein